MELMELLYWKLVPTKGSPREKIYARVMAQRSQNLDQGARPDHTQAIESTCQVPPWPEDADLETQMAIGRALMSGHGLLLVLSLSLFTHSEFTKTKSMIQNYLKMHTHLMVQTVGPSCSFLSINSLLLAKQHIHIRIRQLWRHGAMVLFLKTISKT